MTTKILPLCQGTCGRHLRPRGTGPAAYPGTVVERARGLCVSCYRHADLEPLTAKTPSHCLRCKRPMRDCRTKLVDAPGTVSARGRGYCITCWRTEEGQRGEIRAGRPESCRNCSRPMRPAHTTVSEHPGTLQHKGNGLCGTCYQAEQLGRPVGTLQPLRRGVEFSDHIQAEVDTPEARALRAYMADRAARKATARGVDSPRRPMLSRATRVSRYSRA